MGLDDDKKDPPKPLIIPGNVDELRRAGIDPCDFNLSPSGHPRPDIVETLRTVVTSIIQSGLVSPEGTVDLSDVEPIIDKLTAKLDLQNLFIPQNPNDDSAIDALCQTLDNRHQTIDGKMLSTLQNHFSQQNAALVTLLQAHIGDESLTTSVAAVHLSGILANPSPVHVHDLCSDHGYIAPVLTVLRKSEENTTVDCWDNNDKIDPTTFTAFHQLFNNDSPQIPVTLHTSGIKNAVLDNKPDADNYWFVRFPGGAINDIVEKALVQPIENFPQAIIIIPCNCHCYNPEVYPISGN